MEKKWDENCLKIVVKESKNKSETLHKLGLHTFTGNYDTLNRYLKKYNIDISHFKRMGNIKNLIFKKKIQINEILVSGSTYSNRTNLKKRLYEEGFKKPICELCGQGEIWYGKRMSLILDHINGINYNNCLENLRIVCPNCNATLSTHCGRNVKDIKRKKIKTKIKKHKYCFCGKEIRLISKMCIDCHNKKNRKVERPPKEQLFQEVKKLGYSATGRKYGVSDNAIRKWIKYYKPIIKK